MPDDNMDGLLERIRSEYNPPPETPREEMWSVIQGRMEEGRPEAVGQGTPSEAISETKEGMVLSLDEARRFRRPRQPFVWAMGAAAILVLGLGIGRMTAPGASPSGQGGVTASSGTNQTAAPGSDILRIVALDHLARTESLLTLARADASAGGMEASVGNWSRGLLAQTRLIMDAQEDPDPLLQELMEDLELVLVQLVGAAAMDGDPAKIQSEWNLALEGLEDTEVLSRIRAVLPTGARFMGT